MTQKRPRRKSTPIFHFPRWHGDFPAPPCPGAFLPESLRGASGKRTKRRPREGTQERELFEAAARLGTAYPQDREQMPEAVRRTGAVLFLIITVLFAISLALDVGRHKRGAGQ